MITKYKIFESVNKESDLADQFSQEYVEDFFDNNYEINVDEAALTVNLWSLVEPDKVRDDIIKDSVDSSIHDSTFKRSDYIDYIKKLKKISNIEHLQTLTKKQLIDLVANAELSQDFFEDYYENKWGWVDPEEILYDIWGKHAVQNDLYSYLKPYISSYDIMQAHLHNIQYEYKYEYIRDYIAVDKDLQKDLLKMNPNNIEDLFEVMDEVESIGPTYEFQKLYIDVMSKDKVIPLILKDISEKFELNKRIKIEFKEHMYVFDAEKYNL